MPGKHPQKNLLKKNINLAMDYHKPMMAPKKLKTDVGLHGPFKMVMGAHDNVSPGPMKKHHVQKFSYMYPQGNAFIGAKVKAEKAGKDSFEVDGKKYQVRMDKPMDHKKGHEKPQWKKEQEAKFEAKKAEIAAEKARLLEITKKRREKIYGVDQSDFGEDKPQEHHGPNAYNGPNMADIPMPMDGHGKPMKYPREDYSAIGNAFTGQKDEKDNGNGNGNGKKSDGPKKPPTAADNLSKARARRKAARQQLKADRINRRAKRMENRRK